MKTSSSFKSFAEITKPYTNSPLSHILKNKDVYFAHTHPKKPKETLDEHMELVIKYFQRLSQAHGLDSVVDRLIRESIPKESQKEERVGNFVKDAFFKAILYHDFGKINHLFQWDRDKMANPEKSLKVVKHKVGTQHSIISSYLYLMHLLDNDGLEFEGIDQEFTDFMLITFSYSILKHHSARLNKLQEIDFQDHVRDFSQYLELFDISIPQDQDIQELHELFEAPDAIADCIHNSTHLNIDSFNIYALLKLQFSLLTSADYYATGEYMQSLNIDDFGLLEGNIRQHITQQFKTSKEYNKALFKHTEQYINIPFDDLKERHNDNLNTLRQKLASEALSSLREHPKKNLFYLEAPTGGGKTNISLALITEILEQNPSTNKVFYVFPFTTLITQTFKAIKDTLHIDNEHIIQLHSKSGFHQKSEEGKDGIYGDERVNFLNNHFVNYPITLLSHIKFFNILKGNAKDNNYIYHRLANSIVIIDELQTYAPKHWDKVIYFLSKYAHLFNMKVVLMSATLPKLDELLEDNSLKKQIHSLISHKSRQQFFQNPNFAKRAVFDFSLLEEYKWKRPKGDEERNSFLHTLLQRVLDEAQIYQMKPDNHTGSVRILIEFITKKTASQFFRLLQYAEGFEGYKKYLISGEILDPRRQQIIEEMQNENKENAVLVTTQVVEAGVDIDMDLGFKDRSLIDSDEQLAGRVNRNAKKDGCKVFMFDFDSTNFIYREDKRLKVKSMTDKELYQQILTTKDFDTSYYQAVNTDIKKRNASAGVIGLDQYLRHIEQLNFKLVHEDFQLIEQDNESVFVPLKIPKDHFHQDDVQIIKLLNIPTIYDDNETPFIDGVDVWDTYNQMVEVKTSKYIQNQVALKRIYSILSKFIFSAFESQIKVLLPFCDNGDGFEDYQKNGLYYLSNWKGIYSYEGGINIEEIEDNGAFL